jgi:hypothetical protein
MISTSWRRFVKSARASTTASLYGRRSANVDYFEELSDAAGLVLA